MSIMSSRNLATAMANRGRTSRGGGGGSFSRNESRSGGNGNFRQPRTDTGGSQAGGGRSGGGKTSPRGPTYMPDRTGRGDVKWERPGDQWHNPSFKGFQSTTGTRLPAPTKQNERVPVAGLPYTRAKGFRFNPRAQIDSSSIQDRRTNRYAPGAKRYTYRPNQVDTDAYIRNRRAQ